MKSPFLVLLTAALALNTDAQYAPMLTQGHTWQCINYGLILTSYQFYIGDDSVRNEITYKTLWLEDDFQEPFVYGLLTEDTETGLIYILQGEQPVLLYDFSLEINDQTTVSGVGGTHTITVTDVGTVQVNGTDRKKITFTDEGAGGYWIEGIGSVYGLPDAALGMIMDYFPQVTCFYEEGELAWDNPDITDSECTSLGISEDREMAFTVYPNPSSDFIRFQVPSTMKAGSTRITVREMTGQIVTSQSSSSNGCDITRLSPGIYLICIEDKASVRSYCRFIRE